MGKLLRCLGCLGLTLCVCWMSSGRDAGALEPPTPHAAVISQEIGARDGHKVIRTAQRTKKKARTKKGMAKKSAEMENETPAEKEKTADTKLDTPAKAAADDGALKFSRDIAPIFVNNCQRCHSGPQAKSQFNLTTFDGLLKGGKKGSDNDIVPGKPDESELVKRIRGDLTPKMPPGNRENLGDSAIEKIANWIKAGAILDAGHNPKDALEKYAPTKEQIELARINKLPPEERQKHFESVGLDRFKKGDAKNKPEVTSTAHFILFAAIPQKRATAALKDVEQQYTALKGLLGAGDNPVKINLYVYNDLNSFVEYARSVESREVEAGDQASAKLEGLTPYVAVVDPLNGRDDPNAGAAASKPASRKKDKKEESEETSVSGDRTLAGVLVEQLAVGMTQKAGKPPAWLSMGVGAYFEARVEPRSPYIQRLRHSAFQQAQKGWTSAAIDALGGQSKTEEIRAVGFAIIDWIATTSKPSLTQFVRGMLEGQEKLDDVIQRVFNGGTREQFLSFSDQYVQSRYGRGR